MSAREPTLLEQMHSHTLRRVGARMTEDYRQFLKTCAHFLAAGKAPPPLYAAALAQCLEHIRMSDDPWKEPLLKRRRGEKAKDLKDRQRIIADDVAKLRAKGFPLKSDSRKKIKDGAADAVAKKRNKTVKHVLALYHRFYPVAEQ